VKKRFLILVLAAVAFLALAPVGVMALKTVFVRDVVLHRVSPGSPAPEGFVRGVVKDLRLDSASESTLKVDVDRFLEAAWTTDDDRPFLRGEAVFFSPPLVYFKDTSKTLTLFHDTPRRRSALWDRAVVVEVEGGRVTLNVERILTLRVPNESLASLDLVAGSTVVFQSGRRFSGAHYATLFTDKKRLGLLAQTLAVAGLTVLSATVLGTLFALVLVKLNTPGRVLLSVLYIVPLLIPPYITAIAWTQLLGEKGFLTELARMNFGADGPPVSIYGVGGSVLVLSLTYFPIVTLLVSAGLRGVSAEMEEAGLVAVGRCRTLWSVSLRSVLPYILSGAVFVLVFTLSSSAAPFLLRLQLFSSQVLVAFQTDLSGAEAMTVGVPLVLLALGAVVLQGVVEHRRTKSASARSVRRGLVIGAGPWRWLGLAFCMAVLTLAVAVPIGVLMYTVKEPRFLKDALLEMGGEIKTSLYVSIWTATLAVMAGGLLGYLAARVRGRRGILIEVLVMLPYAAPAAVLGVGVIEIFNRPGILGWVYTTEAILIWTFLLRFLPFSVKPAIAAVKAVNPQLEEAARVHGIPGWRRVLLVLRMAGKGLAAGWILVFILSLGELDAALLVHPAGLQTMPIRIFNAIHFGHVELVASLCLILIFIISLPLLLYMLVTARRMEIA
jgi:iron(III) transport system permease protein